MTSSENHPTDTFKATRLGDDRTSLRESSRGDGPSLERSMSDDASLARPNRESAKSDGPSLPSKQVLDLAFKIKAEEAREKQDRLATEHHRKVKMRYKLFTQFGLASLILAVSFAVYFVYSDMRTKTQITAVETNFIEKINRAYGGEQAAYEEIVRRIPVLADSRLAKIPKQDDFISEPELSSKAIEPHVEPNIVISSEIEVAEVAEVKVYSSQQPGAPIIRILANDGDVRDTSYGEEWSSITLATGFPVWIHGDFVAKMAGNMLKVDGNRVNMRATPDLSPASIVGRVNDGDSLQILGQSGSWYQVNSPADLKGWVKTKNFKNLLQ